MTEVTAEPGTQILGIAVEVGDEPTAVYRFFDCDGVLLYVGITKSLTDRFSQHSADKWWWPQVATKTAVLYASREAALAEESRAIIAELPRHNIAGRTRQEKVKRPAAKTTGLPRPDLRRGPRAPRDRDDFYLDSDWLARVDAFAEDRGFDRFSAVFQLLLAGLVRSHYLKTAATMEDLDGEVAAMAAYNETWSAGS